MDYFKALEENEEADLSPSTVGPNYRAGPHFSATVGAMDSIDRWCKENGGGQAILAFSFG